MKTTQIFSAGAAILMTALMSCEKAELYDSFKPATGKFSVKMTDSPADYEALEVEIKGVDYYLEEKGWIAMNNEVRFVSVLDLTNGKEIELASAADVNAGIISKVRIVFGDNHTLAVRGHADAGGVNASASAKIDLRFEGSKEIVVETDAEAQANAGVSVLLDFDAAQSVIREGEEYYLKPMIRAIADASTGIKGTIKGTARAAVRVANGESGASTYTDANGEFLIRGLDEGTYELIVYPERDLLHPLLEEEYRFDGFAVVKGQITSAGTITL